MFAKQLLMIGTTELLLVAGIALLLFGGKKVPEMMKGMGQGVKSFKDAVNGKVEEPSEESPHEAAESQEEQPTKDNGAKA